MSASRECYHPDNYVVLTVDIEDCPMVEFPLSKLFDVATSTLVVNYLQLLHDYVGEIVEDTPSFDAESKLHLLRTQLGVFHRTEDGTIISMRQPALQRRITQTLRRHGGTDQPIIFPILIRFLCSDINLPPRRFRFPIIDARVDRSQHSSEPSTTAIVRSQTTESDPNNHDDGHGTFLGVVSNTFDERIMDASHVMLMSKQAMNAGEAVSHRQHAMNSMGKAPLTNVFVQLQRDDAVSKESLSDYQEYYFDSSTDCDTASDMMVKYGNSNHHVGVLVNNGMQADESGIKTNIVSTTSSPTTAKILDYMALHYEKWIHGTKITLNEISLQFFLSLITMYQPIDRGRNESHATSWN